MDKTVLKNKVNTTKYTLDQLNSWIDALPVKHKFETPDQFKPGDIIYSRLINHPCVLLKHLDDDQFLATGFTTDPSCKQILCPCESRFFPDSFITKSLFTVTTG